MSWLDFDEYERMTPDECWQRYDWGCEALDGTHILHMSADGRDVFIDEVDEGYGGRIACEVYSGKYFALDGQWFADTMEDAVRGAFVDAVGYGIMREEGNCEDAVNAIAREAYVALFGECPMHEMDVEQVDALLGMAREFVKGHIELVSYDWEEF